ncbi:MAG: DNA polymerase III subunit [Vicinamibacterales bacterium]
MVLREVVGHRAVIERLSRALARGTLPPSLLFGGPDGVGKRTIALAVATTLNCERPRRGDDPASAPGALPIDACGECATCRRIAAGTFAEIVRLAPDDTGAIKIGHVRAVLDRVGFRPFEGRLRVVIVDDADTLNVESQNALLKSLEEPNASTAFILVSARPDALLTTVRSRCPQFRFGALPAAALEEILVERRGFDRVSAGVAIAVADGSVSQALAVSAEGFGATRELAESVLRSLARDPDALRRLNAAKLLVEKGESTKKRSGAAGERATLSDRLAALSLLLRDVSVLATGAADAHVANVDRRGVLAELTRAFDGPRLVRAFGAVEQARLALDRHASPKLVADWLAFQL